MNRARLLFGLVASGFMISMTAAQTSYPMITHAHPVAVQRGKASEVRVEGQQDFSRAYKVLVEGEGIVADVVQPESMESVAKSDMPAKPANIAKQARRAGRNASVKLKIAPTGDVLPGVREFRIITSFGVSSIGQILVVDEPVLVESAKNNTLAQATDLMFPCVACGRIEVAEDIDYYKFKAEAGQTLTFEVWCARIEDKIHDLQKHADPLLTIHDSAGRELASNDDFAFADSLLSHHFEQAGEYYLQVRDAKYDGDPRWVYAVRVTDKAYASHVFPLAVQRGQATEVEAVGPVCRTGPQASDARKTTSAKIKLSVPPNAPLGMYSLLPDEQRGLTPPLVSNPVTVLVSGLPQLLEQEPNDQPKKATRMAIPSCVNGRIGAKRDLDHYVFAAKKGQAIRFQVHARRFGTNLISGLDASLDILAAKGQVLMTADDTSPAIKDPALVFNPPSDGDYVLRVRDLLHKGGDHFIYALEAEPAMPDFTLRCDSDKAMLGPGSRTAWYVHVTRTNGFDGPVQVDVKGLPKGVSASPLVIPPTMTQGLLVLSATADAQPDAANVQVIGSAKVKKPDGKEEELTRIATPNEEIYLPGGGRGRFDVAMHTVAVVERSDIESVEVNPKTVSLKPGEEVRIEVKIKRRPEYDGPVTLDVKLQHLRQVFGDPLPPGVTLVENKSKTLLGKGSEGHIVLRAEPNAAPIENVPISVSAYVSINFVVKIGYSSEVISLTVRAP